MNQPLIDQPLPSLSEAPARPAGLRSYYYLRALVAAAWVAAAFAAAHAAPWIAAALLVAYPAWDALANGIDAARGGGLARNRIQALNLVVSVAATLAVALVIGDAASVLAVFGVWAIASGLFQLAVGIRRWPSHGAQWAMVLSGGQSALAGGWFLYRASTHHAAGIVDVAPYAAFGAFYFLVSALWLTLRGRS